MLRPKKHMGQNFLIDEAVLEEIADHIDKTSGGVKIVEIGAGTGNLTAALLRKKSRHVVAVELDSRCIPYLKKLQCSNLSILHGDARKIEWGELGKDLYIVGNLPYNIAKYLILQWTEITHLWSNCTIMVQKEVGDRILQEKGSSLSIITSLFFHCKKILSVKSKSFHPQPKVESIVIHCSPRKEPIKVQLPQLKQVLKMLFQNRRKMISHSLNTLVLKELEIPPRARPEELTLAQLILLAENLRRLQSA